MTIQIHRAAERGSTLADWLQSKHSFSFNEYYDPARMGFGALRVLNDDVIAPGKGFGEHGHANMEIVTILLQGTLQHLDSTGNEGLIRAGDIQRMSAGRGLRHAEINASQTEPVHLLQLWIEPKQAGIPPSYDQKSFRTTKNALIPIVSGDRRNDSLYMHQHGVLLLGNFEKEQHVAYAAEQQAVYIFVIKGSVVIGKEQLGERDAAAIRGEENVMITALADAQLLIIDVPDRSTS